MASGEGEKRSDILDQIADLTDPVRSARRAGLHYVRSDGPGYRRKKWGRGFTYLDSEGRHLDDPEVRSRIDQLAIPPAWTEVWISESPMGHIQATGRDDRGRKQYIYHEEWERVRNESKYNRMIPFARVLPTVRERCRRDISRKELDREKVLATVVTLLDRTLIRVGNTEYARRNRSFGLTTLRDRHVDFEGATCTFSFKGKSGKKHTIELNDRRLARIVRHCRDIPGYELFQYYDASGDRGVVDSADVNAYLRETTGFDASAKDFRTWGGSVQAAVILNEMGPASSESDATKKLAATCRAVGEQLGNTAAICRSYYIHPLIVDAYEAGKLNALWERHLKKATGNGLEREEEALLAMLIERTESSPDIEE